MQNERLERLKNVLAKIKLGSRSENSFNELNQLRKQEYELEGGATAEYVMGNYRHNLEQTGWKQADSYIAMKKKRPIKGAPTEYSEFINNFKQDVSEEITRMEMRARHEEKEA